MNQIWYKFFRAQQKEQRVSFLSLHYIYQKWERWKHNQLLELHVQIQESRMYQKQWPQLEKKQKILPALTTEMEDVPALPLTSPTTATLKTKLPYATYEKASLFVQ